MKEIVIATRNPGKLEEFKVLMKDLEVELRSLEEWPNVPEPEETGKTFMANARLKAVYYAKETGLPCIADDSGLEVLALEGAPGVRSARYAGEEATDEENNKLLLQTMKFQVKRTCRFRCALAVAAPNGKILLESDGICDGMLPGYGNFHRAADEFFGTFHASRLLSYFGRSILSHPRSSKTQEMNPFISISMGL